MKDNLDAALDAVERKTLAECDHGHLARSCQACDALTEILAISAELASEKAANAELRAGASAFAEMDAVFGAVMRAIRGESLSEFDLSHGSVYEAQMLRETNDAHARITLALRAEVAKLRKIRSKAPKALHLGSDECSISGHEWSHATGGPRPECKRCGKGKPAPTVEAPKELSEELENLHPVKELRNAEATIAKQAEEIGQLKFELNRYQAIHYVRKERDGCF